MRMNTPPEDIKNGEDADSSKPYEPREEEIAQMRAATPAEGQAVDEMILRECSGHWKKIARIIGDLLDEFDEAYEHLPLAYLQARMQKLEDLGQAEIAGDVWAMRFSEIRLANAESKVA
jgi:hypothetical protein